MGGKGCKLVALVRVSTEHQGADGLRIAAQNAAIETYRKQTGCTLIKTYTEVETATHNDVASRPMLMAAIAHAKRANATLVIAKLDRLVRSTALMTYLRES